VEFHFLQTEDGSPSLKLGVDAEGMHNIKGAFSETVYIYGSAISATMDHELSPSFLSLGLGLGYNELLTIGLCISRGVSTSKIYGESFEAVPELVTYFSKWINGEHVPENFQTAYDKIVSLCATECKVEQKQIKETLAQLIANKQWLLRSELNPKTNFAKTFSCFLFDAFSSKTSPELWDETFLTAFLAQTADERAVLSTYACTGSLKRALSKNGFSVNVRQGFAGKRESTFATRNLK
jgi:hypothetical protein